MFAGGAGAGRVSWAWFGWPFVAGGGSTGWFADPLLMGVAGRGPDVAVAGGLALDIVEGLALMTKTGVCSTMAPPTGSVRECHLQKVCV